MSIFYILLALSILHNLFIFFLDYLDEFIYNYLIESEFQRKDFFFLINNCITLK